MKALTSLACACLVGCAAEAPESPWHLLGAADFSDGGVTTSFALPSGEAWALRVTSSSDTCFQLAEAITVAGASVAKRFSGPDCAACALRTSTVPGAGVFVVEQLSQVRFGRVDCETLTPSSEAGEGVTVEARALESASAPLALSVRWAQTEATTFDGAALLAAAAGELGVSLRLATEATVAAPSSKVRFHIGAPAALAALDDLTRVETSVDVVVAGCLEYDDPLFGPPTAVDGYTPRIPGGAGAADAVFLPAIDCTTGRALSLPVETRARVLAHELGHYLGLFHIDGENLMNPNPSLATSRGLTDAQRAVLRAHPIFQQP